MLQKLYKMKRPVNSANKTLRKNKSLMIKNKNKKDWDYRDGSNKHHKDEEKKIYINMLEDEVHNGTFHIHFPVEIMILAGNP